ncbi:MarR family winged helix-turn-helix transcriptional regulator [Alkalibaculum sporogenes]|nr:MarR family transcriptional regulator [Alkalibaculum sporogenes]
MSKLIEVKIAELASMLPMFIGVLIDGSEMDTSVKLNVSEGKTLMFLHKHEGDPMTDYSRKVGLSKGSFTTVADSLVKKGFIKRVSVSNDRRKYALMLTDIGKDIAKQIDAGFNKHIAKKVSQLEEEDINNLHKALEIMVYTMDKLKEREDQI